MKARGPLPRLDEDSRAFWTGGARGQLLIARCRDCETYIHPPRPVCWRCLSENVAPAPVKGEGVVDTFTINHQAWLPGMDVPFIIARVVLDDALGVVLTTNIVGCRPGEIGIGDRVRVKFEAHGEVFLPLFEKEASLVS